MQIRIDMTIERRDTPGAQSRMEFIERAAATIAQYQIKATETRRRDIRHAFASFETGQRYRRIQIVKDAQPSAVRKHDIAGGETVRTIRGDDGNIRVGDVGAGSQPDALPILI